MKVLKNRSAATHVGLAPMDYLYVVEQEVQPEDGNSIYISVQLWPGGEIFYQANSRSFFLSDELIKPIENYNSLKKTKVSKYCDNFKEIDSILDGLISKTLNEVDDTKYCSGERYGAKFNGSCSCLYGEAVAYLSKEKKYLYLQLQRLGNKNYYSVTEKSVFMSMELGELYSAYFGKKEEVPFLIKTDELDNLGEYAYLKDDFISMNEKISDRFEKGNQEE